VGAGAGLGERAGGFAEGGTEEARTIHGGLGHNCGRNQFLVAIRMNVIETYTKGLLAPRLRAYGLNKEQREVICTDVHARLASLLAHWADVPFRRTILTLGEEEATFWEPREADLEIRSLVVLGVRNSLIEDVHAGTRARRPLLPDADMPQLTAEAIAYFREVHLEQVQEAPGSGLFGALPRRFPNAWQCLSALGHAEGPEAQYSLRKEKAEPLQLGSVQASTSKRAVVTSSGMDAGFDTGLSRFLLMIQRGELGVFASESFSRFTRNPVKLFAILDHVLRHDAVVVTSNYLLSGDYVARRSPLIRPAHNAMEAELNRLEHKGLSPRHKALLMQV
jgi:hypothetical protein